MAKADIENAAKRIMSLTKTCPEVKFFVSNAILRELKRYVEEGNKAAFDAAVRSIKVPRNLISILAKLSMSNSRLKRDTDVRARSLVHDIITLKRNNVEDAKALLDLIQGYQVSKETPDELGISGAPKKEILLNLNKLQEACEELKKLLKCVVENLS